MTSQSSATSPEIGGHKHVPLTELRAAGKHGSFVVQVKENMIEDYTYRRNGMETAGKRLVLLFASADEAAYVSGRMVMWKQDRQEITAAAARFQKGLHFEMSSVVLLQKEQPEYIHTPLKAMIDVRQTTFKPILQGQYPAFLVAPPTTLRDILQLGDGRQRFDLTTLVRLEGQVRSVTTQQGPRMAQDLRLRDGSVLDNGDQALVTTTIFTTTEADMQAFHAKVSDEQPLTFFSLDVTIAAAQVKVAPAFQGFRVELAEGSRAVSQRGKADSIWGGEAAALTQAWQPTGAADYTDKKGILSFCALLEARVQHDDGALANQLFQLNHVHIPYPPASHHYEKRLFWSTRIRDCTGSLDVAIRHKAACSLAEIDLEGTQAATEEFDEQFGGELLSWPLLSSVKLLVTQRGSGAPGESQATETFAEPPSKRLRFLVVEAKEQDPSQMPLVSPSLKKTLQELTCVSVNGDALLFANVSQLRSNSFGVFQVEYEAVAARLQSSAATETSEKRRRMACTKALMMVISKERSAQQSMDELGHTVRLETKHVRDALQPDSPAVTLIAYCPKHALKDFILDPPRVGSKSQYALVLVSGLVMESGEPRYIVEQLQLLRESEVQQVTTGFRSMQQLSTLVSCRASSVTPLSPWATAQADLVECERLSLYPPGSDWDMAALQSDVVPDATQPYH